MNFDLNRIHHQQLKKRHRRGATAVEFAIGVIVLFIFLFGALELGRIYMIRHAADNAAYEAARHAMVPGATRAEAVAFAEDMLDAVGIRDGQIVVTPAVLNESTPEVTVDISVPLDNNGWVVPQFGAGRQIFATATLRTERSAGLQIAAGGSSTSDPGSDDSAADTDSTFGTPPPLPEA
ncbi:MAG: TadE family protein, partial [Planctomycetota bacterium]